MNLSVYLLIEADNLHDEMRKRNTHDVDQRTKSKINNV